MKLSSKATDRLHRWFAWLLVAPVAAFSFAVTAYWTLTHNPLTAASNAGNSAVVSDSQLALSRARAAKLQVILGASKAELATINADIKRYSGKAVATQKWASSSTNIKAAAAKPAPATNATTGASGVKP